jgi:hypothetical protein
MNCYEKAPGKPRRNETLGNERRIIIIGFWNQNLQPWGSGPEAASHHPSFPLINSSVSLAIYI